MKYSQMLWRIVFAITVLVTVNNTMHIRAMEPLTKNQKLLQSIKEDLPKDVQEYINKMVVLLKMSDFLLSPTEIDSIEEVLKIPVKKVSCKITIDKNNEVWTYYDSRDSEGHPIVVRDRLLVTLAGYRDDYDTRANVYEDKIVISSKNEPVKIWSIPDGQLLHTLITNARPIKAVMLIDHKVVTVYQNASAKIWPLYIHYKASEFNQNGEPFMWNKDTVTIPQADLIARMHDETQADRNFIINTLTEDGKIFLTLNKNIRIYLRERLRIMFSQEFDFLPHCVVQ